jgi:hypothetical protein
MFGKFIAKPVFRAFRPLKTRLEFLTRPLRILVGDSFSPFRVLIAEVPPSHLLRGARSRLHKQQPIVLVDERRSSRASYQLHPSNRAVAHISPPLTSLDRTHISFVLRTLRTTAICPSGTMSNCSLALKAPEKTTIESYVESPRSQTIPRLRMGLRCGDR